MAWQLHDAYTAIERCETPQQIAVYVCLRKFMNKERQCWPSEATLSAMVHLSTRQVGRVVRELADLKLISIKRRWGQRVNVYTMVECRDTGVPTESAKCADVGVPTHQESRDMDVPTLNQPLPECGDIGDQCGDTGVQSVGTPVSPELVQELVQEERTPAKTPAFELLKSKIQELTTKPADDSNRAVLTKLAGELLHAGVWTHDSIEYQIESEDDLYRALKDVAWQRAIDTNDLQATKNAAAAAWHKRERERILAGIRPQPSRRSRGRRSA